MLILNPSHDITLKGLPSEILDAYVRYKKGSRAIVSWLVQYGPRRYQAVKTLPIKELASLAKQVINNIHELPEVIDFQFRETIAARKRLSQFFRKTVDQAEDDADTVNHEHFTTSLSTIYAELCEHCQTRTKKRQQNKRASSQVTLPEPIYNHFTCLPVEDSFESLAIDDDDDNDKGCSECLHETKTLCPGPQAEVDIENDDMSIAIETASTLERIHETIAAAESCWLKAGSGTTHFVAATAITNAAWANLRDLENQLRIDDEVLGLGVLHQRCCLFTDGAPDSNDAISKVHALLESLIEADRAVTHYSNCHKLTIVGNCPLCVQKPVDYIQEVSTTETDHKKDFCLALMDNILHLMCGTRSGSIVLNSSPAFAEIGYLLTHRDDKTTSFRCILGIHLLATTYKAYMSTLPRPTSIASCRITALKLSKQACTSIDLIITDKDIFPCQCPQTLAFHLQNLKDDMEIYTKYKCWDLYFQSPWISGTHVIEMLDMLSYYGMRLFHYRHYVGAVVHSYNVLTQLAGLQPIPILEYMCTTFSTVFFPGGRPTYNFKNSWARYIGARLKFKKGHKRNGNDKDSWCMAVPAHAARDAAGMSSDTERGRTSHRQLDAKFDYARIDPVMKLKQQNWRTDLSIDTTVPTIRRTSTTPLSNSTSPPPLSLSPTTTHDSSLSRPPTPPPSPLSPLTTLHTTLDPLFNSTEKAQPTTTRLNPLSIFHAATSTIQKITTLTHGEATNTKDPKTCICFAQTLFAAADRVADGRRYGGVSCWSKEEREGVVVVVGDALKDGFAGVDVETWCWEF